MKNIIFILLVSCVYLFSAQDSVRKVDLAQDLAKDSIKKVAVIGGLWPLPPVISFWSDLELVYIPKAAFNAMDNSLASIYRPQYKSAKVGNSENVEELLALNADIYICGISNIKICNALKKANLKVIELSTNIDNHSSKATLQHWLDELAKHTDIAHKNKKLLSSITKIETHIASKTKNAPKPKVLIVHRIDKNNISSGYFGHYLITNSGGESILGYRVNSKISLEEVFALNPDIIYISNFTPLLPNELMAKKEWQSISAVQEKRVYKFPLATYRPFAPSLDLGQLLLFMAKHNHPKIFKDLDMKESYRAHFREFYGISLSKNDLDVIFNPSPKAGILD